MTAVAVEMLLLAALVAAVAAAAGVFFARRRKRARELLIQAWRQQYELADAAGVLFALRRKRARGFLMWMRRQRDELINAAGGEYLNWEKAKRVLSGAEESKSPRLEQEEARKMVDKINEDFVEQRLADSRGLFDKRGLTPAQRLAVVRDEDANLINASAGSGKTRTILAKVEYLIARGLAAPADILVLAYNKKTSVEIAAKMKETAPGVVVRTVHALGRNIVKQVEKTPVKISELAKDDQKLGRFFLDLLLGNSALLQRIIAFFSAQLFDGNPAEGASTKDEYWRKCQRQNMRALNDVKLKSHEEVQIANWLILNGIDWEYEKPYPHHEENRQHNPDFYLPEYDLWVEHFGIDEHNNTAPWVDKEKYLREMEWKQEQHKIHQTKLVETYSYESKKAGGLTRALDDKLAECGVEKNPLSAKQVDRLTRGRNLPLPAFINLMQRFLVLCRENKLADDALKARATGSHDRGFLDLFGVFRARYEERLKADGEIDFTDMIVRALEYVRAEKYRSRFKYILVDEYQDMTKVRMELLTALQRQAEDTRLFCVGDDWQSIYRFQGADVRLITHFGDYVNAFARTDLDKTFRYSRELNEFSVMFIMQNPAQLSKKVESDTATGGKPVRVVYHHPDARETKLRRAIDIIAAKSPGAVSCLILGRYNYDKPDEHAWRELRRHARAGKVSLEYSTIHAAKGREADWVIVLENKTDADGRGFPSEMEDDPVLNMLLPENEKFVHAEERRLFYVAVTRARRGVFLFAPSGEASAFIREIDPASDFGVRENAAPYARYVASEGGHDARTFVCPACKGWTIRKMQRKDGGEFYGCTNHPRCDGALPECGECGAPVPVAHPSHADRHVCECGEEHEICPRCSEGVLTRRDGPYSTFWGCSRFAKTDCRYRRNIADSARRAAREI